MLSLVFKVFKMLILVFIKVFRGNRNTFIVAIPTFCAIQSGFVSKNLNFQISVCDFCFKMASQPSPGQKLLALSVRANSSQQSDQQPNSLIALSPTFVINQKYFCVFR